MRRFTLLFIAYLITCCFVSATEMSGVYKVGSTIGSNYATLSSAIADINATTNTITGDIVLEISSDITEPTNFGLAKSLGVYKLTIRPDADVNRTITFTQASANAGPFGHFVIGCATGNLGVALSDATVVATDSVTIDGFADGGNTRRLKLTTSTDALGGSVLVSIVGGCANTIIKNCILENQATGSSPRCIYITQFKGTNLDASPTNILVENNQIKSVPSLSTINGIAIQCAKSGSPNTKITGLKIKNNIIFASGTGIEVYYCNGVSISGNEFKIQKGTGSGVSYGIWFRGSAGVMNVNGNKFTEVSSAQATGTGGSIAIMEGALLSAPFTLNVYNNTFAGMNRTATGGTINQAYIMSGANSIATNVYHNTFYLPTLSQQTTAGYYHAIYYSTATKKADIRNNIFISNDDAKSILISQANNAGTVDNNIYFLRAGNTNARIVDTYSTLAAFQQANQTLDVNSKSLNVNFQDAVTGNLLIAGASIQDINLKVPSLSAVTTDILGKIRDVNYTYAGAHESNLPFSQPTVVINQQIGNAIRSTIAGIELQLNESSDIEIYTANGKLIDKTRANGVYNRPLRNGVYIVTINGKATKFVK